MAFGRLERHPGPRPISEINMTPLIDVMLVLLVIFIVAAPLMASRLALELPRAEGAAPATGGAVLAVTLTPDGRLLVGEQPATLDQLAARAAEAARRDPATEVHLRADTTVPYGRVAEAIGRVQAAGLSRIGLVTEAGAGTAPAPATAAPAAPPPR